MLRARVAMRSRKGNGENDASARLISAMVHHEGRGNDSIDDETPCTSASPSLYATSPASWSKAQRAPLTGERRISSRPTVARVLQLGSRGRSYSGSYDVGGIGIDVDETSQNKMRRIIFIAGASCSCLTAICVVFTELVGVAHLLAVVLVSCLAYSELVRVRGAQRRYDSISIRLRKLMERRRAAGLRRLESETAARRALWSAPPASGNAATLRRSSTSMPVPAAVDYRLLAIAAFEHLSSLVTTKYAATNTPTSMRHTPLAAGVERVGASMNDDESRELERWILRQLLQSGARPNIDAELFRLLHTTLNSVERHADCDHSTKRGDTARRRECHCRLCLTQLYGTSTIRVRLSCGHSMCKSCALSLVDSAIQGMYVCPASNMKSTT